MWAALSLGGHTGDSWSVDEFFQSGEREIARALALACKTGFSPPLLSALDFGCGPGRLSYGLVRAGFQRVVGVDIAESMIDVAIRRNQFPGACTFLHSVDPDLGRFRNGSMSFVYSARVLQHMPTVLALGYVREFVRLLAPGGRAVFQMPLAPRWNPGGILVRLAPSRIVNRFRSGMEMHGTDEALVEKAVSTAGGSVYSSIEDDFSGPRWRSRTFVVARGS